MENIKKTLSLTLSIIFIIIGSVSYIVFTHTPNMRWYDIPALLGSFLLIGPASLTWYKFFSNIFKK
jgi:hypothetical protein